LQRFYFAGHIGIAQKIFKIRTTNYGGPSLLEFFSQHSKAASKMFVAISGKSDFTNPRVFSMFSYFNSNAAANKLT
jgi:hypothetical protein